MYLYSAECSGSVDDTGVKMALNYLSLKATGTI